MIMIEPQDLVLRVAAGTLGASEVPANSNAGPFVERVLKVTGLPKGNPWCAAFVAAVGVAALGSQWPVPKTASCYQLGKWAEERGVLSETALPGSIFLMHYPSLGRFAHTGFIVALDNGGYRTNEGNTSGDGSREGWLVAEKLRKFGARDRFIHWWKA